MHSTLKLLSSLALAAALPAAVQAALIATENFNSYTVSNIEAGTVINPLQGNNGGTGWTSAWTVQGGGGGPGQIGTGAPGFTGNYATVTANTFDQFRTFSAVTSGSVWIAWKAAYAAPASSTSNAGYGILGVFNATGSTEIAWLGDTNGGGAALRSTVAGNTADHFTLTANTVYNFAMEISGIGAGAGNASVNIYTFDSEGVLTALRSVSGLTVTNVGRIRLWGGFATQPRFDNIFVGTTQASVIEASIIPEPSAFAALLGLGALGAAALRRRRG